MNRAVRFACAALFVGTTICSLVMSASATVQKANSVHIPGAVTWSAVGVLELLSLAGTLRWLTASTSSGRTHAIVVVAAVATVTGQAGWSFYGWWGALAPLAVVGTVHMVAETLRDVTPVRAESERSHAVTPEGVQPAHTPETDAQDEPPTSPTSPTFAQGAPDEVIVAALAGRDELPGRDAIKAEFRCGTKKAERVLAQAQATRRPHLVTTAQEATS